MWTFLATEVMFFSGLFSGYAAYRLIYPEAFAAASYHLHVVLGSVNPALLLCSSLATALAVSTAQAGQCRALIGFLLLIMMLGTAFLGIKAIEYYREYDVRLVPAVNFAYDGPNPQQVELFFIRYFTMTGLCAVHLTLGIGALAVMAMLAWRHRFSAAYYTPVELAGLYWHFVDIVWVFLFPLLYLINLHRCCPLP